jgi:hypothetical protein
VVVEGIALERQQHEVAPMHVLGGCDAEDDRHHGSDVLDVDSLSMEVADGGLEGACCGGLLSWCRHRCCWCCNSTKTRWRCSDSEDGSELELEGGCRAARAAARSARAVVAPEVVAAAVAMEACSCYDLASTAAACSQEAATMAWTVARVTAKSDGVTPEAAEATTMVSGLMGSGVAMAEVRWGPRADGSTPRAGQVGPVVDGSALEQAGLSSSRSSRPSRVD